MLTLHIRLSTTSPSHPLSHTKHIRRPLYYMGLELFKHLGLVEHFNIDMDKLRNFLNNIELGYHKHNPYHNNTHAADVAQTSVFFLTRGGIERFTNMEDRLAYVIAAIVHDFDHPGYNNAFMVHTGNPIAITHNDSSVLERHHCSEAFKVMMQEQNNIFASLSEEQRLYVRKAIINLVIATDFGDHFSHVKEYQARRKEGLDPEKEADRFLVMKVALKAADISHTSKASRLHFLWTERITREFHKQGDEEREMGKPVAGPMDRNVDVPASQAGFIKFLVLPLYEAFCEDFKESQPCLQQLRANHAHWIAKSEMKEKTKETQ
eukprot:TRINITY_DN3080_c0_g1_i4.p1 TRINITY_DN3080_c0_g1~~TRINITY_DN3080_c0_g1_i4.p1  ORF type:complete len:321 (-),score=98.99 TRINITY_DN3080_c0_g1_i4:408-1370(-)